MADPQGNVNDNLIQRVIPHSEEAEQSVIGSMLRDKDAVVAAAEMLTPDDFYERRYSLMFEAMLELSMRMRRSISLPYQTVSARKMCRRRCPTLIP